MNKSELIDAIAAEANLSKADAERSLNALTGTITETLAQRDSVVLTGFGTFDTSDRAARKGRNPQTGEEMQIPATTVPKFKAGKGLKDAVKQ